MTKSSSSPTSSEPVVVADAPPATRLAGMRLDQLHFRIQHEQRGTSTCTQLNDLLRSIGDAAALIALLPVG